ncbi:hypothetical protein MNL18_17520 [Acinetobacter baumannii]|uniref:hypothetical protein n=1 Tax=Acinetobacter baumannii TaxID=470 RepID=UPI001FB00D1C|nr:hypothetical protein [Acinetobacter baumannii]MCJ0779999.1 hypothetical protein [Acinetobacter baumannii]MCJ0798508.1 hypothetical protein [Acinetobacter baumannii]
MKSIWHMILLFLAIIALVTSSIFIVILNFYIQSTNTFIWLKFIVIAISLIYILSFIWNTFSELLKENDFKIIYVGLTLLLFMSVLASGTYLHLYTLRDQQNFTKLNNEDAKSKEFGIIQKIGRDNDVYIKLGNTRTSWALTRLAPIPDSSGASMYLMNGYCSLNYSDVSSQYMKKEMIKNISNKRLLNENLDIPKLSIMMHEFAHCIDIKRDYLTFNINADNSNKTTILGTNAITPKFRSHVKDLITYQEFGSASTLWKEVFADLYMAGYLYINHPGIADQIVQNWSKLREKNAEDDEGHSTSCWLNIAQKLPKPKTNKELITWSDNIRSTSKCKSDFYKS